MDSFIRTAHQSCRTGYVNQSIWADKEQLQTKKTLIEVQDVPASHWAFNNVQVVLKLAL